MESVMRLAKGVGTVREMSRDTAFAGGMFQEEFSDEVELLSATVGGATYP